MAAATSVRSPTLTLTTTLRITLLLWVTVKVSADHQHPGYLPLAALTRQEEQEIAAFITTVLGCRNMPGVAVTVVSSSRVLLQGGYGVTDVSTRAPVTADTLYPIASNTKAFTATLLAMLLEESNGTDWDTPIKKILGSNFELYNDVLTEQVSLRDLLAHRTGVPDYFLPLMAVYPDDETRKKMVWRLRYHKPIYPFRSRFRYNNYMYMLAGYVAEVLGKASWEDLVRTRMFEPLNMTSSTFIRHLTDWDRLAPSYAQLDSGELHPVDKVLIRQVHVADPAGSVLSTVRDVANWLQLHLRGGVLPDGRRLLSAHRLADTYREEMPSPAPMSDRDLARPMFPVSDVHLAYDMGWMTNMYRGFKRVWHSGGLTTYKSQVWFYPDLDLGMAVVCSGPPRSTTSWALINLLQYLTDVFTSQTPWLNATTVCSFPEPWGKTPPPPSPAKESNVTQPGPPPGSDLTDDPPPVPLEDLIGVYTHPGFGDLTFSIDRGAPNGDEERNGTHNSPTGSPAAGRLRMLMGQFLEATLFYNRSDGVFYTNLTGRYWYSSLKIPLRFSSSRSVAPLGWPQDVDGVVDTVHMPLNSPWLEVEPYPFTRGRHARAVYARRGVENVLCTSGQEAALHTERNRWQLVPIIMVLLVTDLSIQR